MTRPALEHDLLHTELSSTNIIYAASNLAKYSIRVSCLRPGLFPNISNQSDLTFNSQLASKTMLKRFGKNTEIAGAVALLVSDASSFMTGSNITVDGGWTHGKRKRTRLQKLCPFSSLLVPLQEVIPSPSVSEEALFLSSSTSVSVSFLQFSTAFFIYGGYFFLTMTAIPSGIAVTVTSSFPRIFFANVMASSMEWAGVICMA